jgi:hypothetical protein
MMRYVVAAAGALAMMSSLAIAETTVVRTSPGYVAAPVPHKTTVVKKRVDRYGRVITVKKSRTDGYSGSSVSRTRTVTNPYTGVTRSRTITAY